jgi:hypothetical protein
MRFHFSHLALVCLLASVAGCRRDEVSYARVPKEQRAAAAPGMAMGGGGDMGARPDVPAPPKPTGANALQWTLPKGWTQELTGGMRYATIKPSVPGKIEASVVVLPGPAGGDLANVNRWRGQIGLPPIDDAGLAKARTVVNSKAGPVALYDFTSEGEKKTRVLAAQAVVDGNSWFLKMTGDAEPMAAARGDFVHLLESLHLD